MQPRGTFSQLTLWMLLAALFLPLMGGIWSRHASAQTVQRLVRQEVPIYEDNLDDARKRAVYYGQGQALDQLVREVVAEPWMELFKRELRRSIFSRQSRYISLFRIRSQGTSPDRTRYQVALAVELNQYQLTEDLRILDLPLIQDKARPMVVFYPANDPMLGSPKIRALLGNPLRERLALLKRTVPTLTPLNENNAAAFSSLDKKARARLIGKGGQEEALLLEFLPLPAVEGASALPAGWKLRLRRFHHNGEDLGENLEQVIRHENLKGTSQDRAVLAGMFQNEVLEPFLNLLRPGSFRTSTLQSAEVTQMRLRVLGLNSVEAQDAFERKFFARGTPFARFSLHTLAADSLTYTGAYAGDRDELEQALRNKKYGEFRIRAVYRVENTLEIDVQRTRTKNFQEMRPFPPEARQPALVQLLGETFADYTRTDVKDPLFTEVEDNGWLNRANPIPFDATFYGFLDSRSDADFYVGEALTPGEKVVLHWYRFGQTNLTPAVRLYDENGVLLAEFKPRTWMRYVHTIPEGQHSLFVEVADRFGYLKVDTGGYLNYHYLLRIERSAP